MTRPWVVVVAVSGCLVAGAAARTQERPTPAPALSGQDLADIQKLSAGYAQSLGTCKGEEWADIASHRTTVALHSEERCS